VNDVSAGRFDPGMLPLCAVSGVPVVLMHMQGTPATMQQDPRYTDVVTEVTEFLAERAQAAAEAGVAPDAIVLDPGIGVRKDGRAQLRLFAAARPHRRARYPILVGVSRKGFIGGLLGGRGPRRGCTAQRPPWRSRWPAERACSGSTTWPRCGSGGGRGGGGGSVMDVILGFRWQDGLDILILAILIYSGINLIRGTGPSRC